MVTVFGLGFVGLTTALGFSEYGHKVFGIEANPERLNVIRSGKLPFFEPGMDEALSRHLGKNFFPTDDIDSAISESEFVYYCVGTPYGEDGSADLTYLCMAIEQTLKAIHDEKFRVLVTKSTIPPSTTEEKIIPFLKNHGAKNIGVANNPEFLREGHCWEDFTNADRIVMGVSDDKTERKLRELYAKESAPLCFVSLNTGEFIKYLSNTSLACLISFANEMSIAADSIGGIDVAKAFRILHMDKRWQNGTIRNYFYPGCGYGGYCLPKDTNAFHAVAKSHGFEGKILREVIALNDSMPDYAAKRIIKATHEKDSCIAILGLAFNAGSDDVRDTPAAKIIKILNDAGYENIIAYDPEARENFAKSYPSLRCRYAESLDEALTECKVIAIITAWPEFKYILGDRPGKIIVDCRYVL